MRGDERLMARSSHYVIKIWSCTIVYEGRTIFDYPISGATLPYDLHIDSVQESAIGWSLDGYGSGKRIE